mmetsp:Transcript_66354/g.74330  ORF Transcript_66354/g.74330 Transcript_66354/m.74330 type:complete len:293 (-) Transcript_66354:471-1349(-)
MPSNNKKSGRKEKDVLERQKLISRMMAAKTRPSLTGSNNGSDSRKRPPSATSKKHTIQSSKPAVIDLTELDETKKSNGTSNEKKKVVMGIHKSFKRPSPAAVMAAARAKAKALNKEQPGDNNDNDQNDKADDAKSNDLKSTRRRKKDNNKGDDTDTDAAKKVSKKRLANLIQNAASGTVCKKDDWSSSSALSNITPEDFWKKIRNWDFVAQLARLQLESNNNNDKNKQEQQQRLPPAGCVFENLGGDAVLVAPTDWELSSSSSSTSTPCIFLACPHPIKLGSAVAFHQLNKC